MYSTPLQTDLRNYHDRSFVPANQTWDVVSFAIEEVKQSVCPAAKSAVSVNVSGTSRSSLKMDSTVAAHAVRDLSLTPSKCFRGAIT